MSGFEEFDREFGLPQRVVRPGEDVIRAYRGALPEALLERWAKDGWCAHRDGFLWVVDPRQFAGIVEDWADLGPPAPLVFMRSAFAHLYLWHEEFVYSLDVQRGGISRVTRNIDRMFELVCDREVQERILRASLFAKVLPILGPLDKDECYGFEPALALGGPGTVETVRRVRMREHLGILAQIHT